MTWVVGGSSLFSYGVIVSDVRVSWDDGTEANLLRKAYRVGPYLLAGFSETPAHGYAVRRTEGPKLGRLQPAMEAIPVLSWGPESDRCQEA